MRKSLLCVLLFFTLFSCMKHDDAYVEGDDNAKKEEEYDKGFPVKDIDPKQDWNLAEQFMVNVSVNYGGNDEYTIKIYSDNPRNADVESYLLGEYTVKDGSTNALPVDALSSFGSVYVCCVDVANGYVMKEGTVEDGKAAVAFGVIASPRGVSERSAVSGKGDLKDLDPKDICKLIDKDNGIFREKNTPKDPSVLNSYEFKSTGRFTVYPVFGMTGGKDEIGFYYYNPTDGGIQNRQEVSLLKIEDNGKNQYMMVTMHDVMITTAWYAWDFANKMYGVEDMMKAIGLRSRAFYIDVPVGYMVGFYVKNEGYTLYSNNKLNNDGVNYSAVIYDVDSNTPRYIGLEDWPTGSGGDNDCNDIIFYIAPKETTTPEVVDPEKPIEKDPMSWTVACEDMGSVGDYDFNDVVFSVSYVSGKTQVMVTPLAAGGTLPATISCGTQDIGEIHALLGGSNTSTMINTGSWGKAGTPKEIAVASDFSMSTTMGHFSLNIDGKTNITAPGRGEAPQMICVSGTWQWPTETTNITKAYSEFGEWGANYGTNKDWWTKATGSVIKRGN